MVAWFSKIATRSIPIGLAHLHTPIYLLPLTVSLRIAVHPPFLPLSILKSQPGLALVSVGLSTHDVSGWHRVRLERRCCSLYASVKVCLSAFTLFYGFAIDQNNTPYPFSALFLSRSLVPSVRPSVRR